MGSSLSLQSRDKRRRLNRLSKPPQNQTVPDSPIPRSPRQPTEKAVSLPTTPTAWRNPWTSTSVPVDPGGTVTENPRSQSVSSKPLRRQTTWHSSGPPVGKRRINSTANLWSQSPTSPTTTPNRQCSVYGRTSFHPSETTTFQPTTLQTNPQSPLIGQPRRSYSVRHRSQRAGNGVQQRDPDRFAPMSSHSRVKSLDTLPIRRRTMLMRPGVATRNASIITAPTSFSEADQEDSVSDQPESALFGPTLGHYLAREPMYLDDREQPLSQLCPTTPNDGGYTHLGALRLGSLRVVNGSVSPCPSDRTRLSHADATISEAMSGSLHHSELHKEDCASRPKSSDGLSVDTEYHSLYEHTRVVDYAPDSLHAKIEPSNHNLPAHPVIRNDALATTLEIPSDYTARDDVDFPASPFSFAKSPTLISGRMMELREAEDESISVCNDEKSLQSLPEKVPERHLSYSSCASSHRRADSGYSSAASHRNSIDSHASIQRSPGFRKLVLAGSPGDSDIRDMDAASRTGNQRHLMNRHLSLQDRKSSCRPNVRGHPNSSSVIYSEQLQPMAAGRPRGSSLPDSRTPRMLTIPQYCARLRNPESTPLSLRSTTLQLSPPGALQLDETVNLNRGPRALHPDSVTSSNSCCFEISSQQREDFVGHNASSYLGYPVLSRKHTFSAEPCQGPPNDGPSQGAQSVLAARRCRRHSSGVEPNVWFFASGNDLPAVADEVPRGRTRSRSIGHQQQYIVQAATSQLL